MAKFETKYGYFTDDGKEYVIKTYKTPRPWVNVISNGDYGLVISQAGGGFSWLTHSEFNRLNRWHQDMVKDDWGKYFYFRNNNTGEVWSPLWMPVKTNLDYYECRYGAGYARFRSSYRDVIIDLTVFIPLNETFEIWSFEITNGSKSDIDISVYTYFEWCLGSSADHHREFHKTFIETEFDKKNNTLFASKRLWEIPLGERGHWNTEYPYYGFITCNKIITDYDADKESFIGNYGNLQNPKGLSEDNLQKSTGKWNDSVAVIKTGSKIKPGSGDHIAFFIGLNADKSKASLSVKKFFSLDKINKALEDVTDMWDDLLGRLTIDTPDEGMNIMVNRWLKYQAIAGRLWGRTAYYQQSGAFGFRDQLQDSLVFLPIDPAKTHNQIKLHARHQFSDGTVLHWWHPISETGLPTKMTDDLLWLPYILTHYINETGDYSILKHKEPYYDNPKKKDSLFNHSIAAIEKVLERFSNRGLPLIGAGDWNDGLSAVGLDMKGESIWMAEFFYLVLSEFSKICEAVKNRKAAKRYTDKAARLKKSFDKYAWDGEWFFRATKDNGEKIGSRKNKEGKIFLNAQSWSVISGIADRKKQEDAMHAVSEHLLKKNGTLLLQPAYTKPDKMIGYLSRYAPGRRENGGVYTHAAAWSIWAYAMLKQKETAFRAYKNLLPIYNGMNPDEYKAEPYVTPGNIDGPDSPNYGMGGWTWYTGSASWYQKIIVDWLLGVRAVPDGLLIDPCIPEEWDSYSIRRIYRGTVYNIRIINEKRPLSGIREIIVDGIKINGNIIKTKNKASVNVQVYISS